MKKLWLAFVVSKFTGKFACFACLFCLFLHKPMIKKKYLQANSFAGFACLFAGFAECHLSDIQQAKKGLQ
jgi:hypothetical protein